MTRPENVRCEHCCYFQNTWTERHQGDDEGICERYPPRPIVTQRELEFTGNHDHQPPFVSIGDGCGEFREEWPS